MDEAKLLAAVAKIPPTWTCVDCGHEYDNGPDGEIPAARRTGEDPTMRERFVVLGDVCRHCYKTDT